MNRGRLIYLIGPSGAGKDTVLRWVAEHPPRTGRLHVARRTITRADDPTEAHEAVTAEQFDALSRSGTFALEWDANGLRYGIRREQLAPLADGQDVIVNGSRGHLEQARHAFPGLFAVQVTTPPEVLRLRLLARGRETPAAVEARLARNAQLPPLAVDAEVVNDATPEQAGRRLLAALGLDG